MIRRPLLCALATVLALSTLTASSARAQRPETATPAARTFVERFITRYNGQFKETPDRPADWNPLTLIERSLTPDLVRALEEDRAAAAANQDEIVGLDFDPFTNSQDPCETYAAGRTAQRADTTMVEIVGQCHGQNPLIPDAVYLLVRSGGEFKIADIVYPQGGSLHGVLRELARMRKASPPTLEVQH